LPELPAVAPGASDSGGFRHFDELALRLGVGVSFWGRDRFDQLQRNRELLVSRILDGSVRDELGRVADNGVKVEVRIAGRVLFVGWAGGVPIAHVCFCHGASCGIRFMAGECSDRPRIGDSE